MMRSRGFSSCSIPQRNSFSSKSKPEARIVTAIFPPRSLRLAKPRMVSSSLVKPSVKSCISWNSSTVSGASSLS